MSDEKKRSVQVNPNRMKRAETLRTLWCVNAQPGSIREDFLQPEYWSHIAALLEPLHRLEVRADDGTYWAEYLVISCERTWAKVKELRWVDLTEVAEEDLSLTEYKYLFRGPHCKHSVIRIKDKVVMAEKLPTKDDALAWIVNHKRNAA